MHVSKHGMHHACGRIGILGLWEENLVDIVCDESKCGVEMWHA